MRKAYLNTRRPLLLISVTVLILAALAACSRLSGALPAAATATIGPLGETNAVELPTDTPTDLPALKRPPAEDPAAAQKFDQGNGVAPANETPSAGEELSIPLCVGQPACADLFVTQSGKPALLVSSTQGLTASAMKNSPTDGTRWVIDTGTPSPDGKWVAYTSLGYETGGPVYLQNIETAQWVNLIEQINAHKVEGQPEFPLDLAWDVIGWFPDSQRLMIGPSDLSSVVIVDRASYTAQLIGFPGGGRGGRAFVTLAPDGGSFLFLGENADGQQALSSYDLASGQTFVLQVVPYAEGFLTNPRFSPDGSKIAYIMQSGQPDTGLSYAMNLLENQGGALSARKLVEGNLSMTVPNWSPDGSYIAFTRNDAAPKLLLAENAPPPEPQGNVWIVSVKDGSQQQVTFINGLARSPIWAKDGRTLAFVTGIGEVELASIDQPGQVWLAAGPSDLPELTNVFFVP